MTLKPGDPAPDFTVPDQNGDPVTLSQLRGQTVVLSFYPKADTPGCTTQACGVRDHRADYQGANAVVLGVSPDQVKAVGKFDQKYGLGFPLLADSDHEVPSATASGWRNPGTAPGAPPLPDGASARRR